MKGQKNCLLSAWFSSLEKRLERNGFENSYLILTWPEFIGIINTDVCDYIKIVMVSYKYFVVYSNGNNEKCVIRLDVVYSNGNNE